MSHASGGWYDCLVMSHASEGSAMSHASEGFIVSHATEGLAAR